MATAATTAALAPLVFVPRATFPALASLPRSYFLGHHKAGLDRMKTLLAHIDLVIECRDYRIPLTSRNPLLEHGLAGKQRLVVYTKRDLGVTPGRERVRLPSSPGSHTPVSPLGARTSVLTRHHHYQAAHAHDRTIRAWHAPTPVHFSSVVATDASPGAGGRGARAGSAPGASTAALLATLRDFAGARHSLTGHRVLVAGMPNVGKSTLLNALRGAGVRRGKAARTGAQPGVTRRVGTGVKVLTGADVEAARAGSGDGGSDTGAGAGAGAGAGSEGVYVLDTPGVFMPYVPDGTAMLKLALCGCVKDGVIPLATLADYLLCLNLVSPLLYSRWAAPTNDVHALLAGVARATGRLGRGGALDLDAAAVWLVQRWRAGDVGRFSLDEGLDDESALERERERERGEGAVSVNQARKREMEARKVRNRERGMRKKGLLV